VLSEEEVRERAQYCCCVLLQLGWLHDNELVEPAQYLDYLRNSSLQLISDEFVATTIEEALLLKQPDGGLRTLLALYEGFVHALCEVIESDIEQLRNGISQDFLRKLASEVGVEIRIEQYDSPLEGG
jgi:hypothetical protein